ncbi:hypothetical protein Si103_00217 [Streptococcus infantarius subsp. infantarius]|nr:hypothetical protein [Streptococcus infantarius subsp. infantarius]MCO4532546.1 hypothetical protein [Streptococcus infantarius subsp. infantarius]MCO4545800.1 hypothetical protein [Streptococcus infantarius subsp. infantarius]MCO4547676.1 hypothetical protein [Streptococcus infantarius subsp. infantarius]MCO4549154.1 hypothetical protein [Streptococcus infantarius subsp. infantarius]
MCLHNLFYTTFILSINKFSKYGIVLVAAFTLATAVQTQFGQTSTKVYAEEIADNDPSLNRMLYIHSSLADYPKIDWLTGNVVTPKGYIVEPADEVEGYPYYTITGSNGKNYSVGDVITTEEPGLFGHADMEDDALYYRYYRTNPNSVSEAPAVSTTPATSLVPTKDNHSMNFVTPSYTQTRSAGIKSETDGKLTSQDLPKTGDTNSKVGMLGMVLIGLGLTSFVYKGRHRRS